MENLAGRGDRNQQIRKELTEAGVDIIEVPFSVIGQLPDFAFHRASHYWEVKGQVPLDVARILYEDPNEGKNVRVAGHADCPPPEERAEHYDMEGQRLAPSELEESVIVFEDSTTPPEIREIVEGIRSTTIFVEDPLQEAARSVVTSYHIDTQGGLNFFVATLRENGVVPQIPP